jgi:hypothetical protein
MYINIYTNYARTKVINELETKTEVILEQISARLSDRVRQATIGRVCTPAVPPAFCTLTNDIAHVSDGVNLTQNHNVLEWIGESTDSKYLPNKNSFAASIGWSGYVDLFKSDINQGLFTPGSHLTEVDDIIGANNIAIIFQGVRHYQNFEAGFGFDSSDANDNFKVMNVTIGGDDERITAGNIGYGPNAINKDISERYQLAHSAYAIVPETEIDPLDPTRTVTNLYLHYDYKPWIGETYRTYPQRRSLLASNIYLFRFRGIDSTIDLKLCLKDDSGLLDRDFIVCKTKAVF